MSLKSTIVQLILNATASGKALLTAVDAAAQRTLLSVYSTTQVDTALTGKADTSHAHAAADITSGTIATARLGSGTANSTTFLRGDQTYAAPSAGIGGSTGSTDRAVIVANGTGGATAQASGVTISAGNVITAPGGVITTGTSDGFWLVSSGNGLANYFGTGIPSLQYGGTNKLVIGSNVNFAAHALPLSDLSADLGSGAVRWGALFVNNITASGLIIAGVYTVATKPNEAANAGKFCRFSDNSVAVWGDAIAAGGGAPCLAWSNGTNWTVFAK